MMRATAEKLSAEDKKKNKETRQEIQLAKIACGTITLFILSWISYAIVTMFAINGYVYVGMSLTHMTSSNRLKEANMAKILDTYTPIVDATNWSECTCIIMQHYSCILNIPRYTSYVTPLSCQIPALVAKTSATWNPLLYCLSHPKFR